MCLKGFEMIQGLRASSYFYVCQYLLENIRGVRLLEGISAFLTQWMWLGVLVLSIEADSHLEEEEDSAFCTEEDSSSVKKIAN